MKQHRSVSTALQAVVTVRRLKGLLLLSIAVPAVMLLVLALYEYSRAVSRGRTALDQISHTIHEHAVKALEVNEIVLDRVSDVLDGVPVSALQEQEEWFHQALRSLVTKFMHIRNVMVWGDDGRPLASSRYYPVRRDMSVADRAFFIRHKDQGVQFSINEPVDGRWGGERIFNISKARFHRDGSFAGVVSVSLSPEYFIEFLRRAVGSNDGFEITLLRDEGEVVASYPAAGPTLPADTPFIVAVQEGRPYSFITNMRGLDGKIRDVVFRQVASYPLHIAASATNASIFAEWRHDLLVAAFLVLPSYLVLSFVIWIAWKRTENEHRALVTAHDEEVKRSQTEEQIHHLRKFEALGHLTSGLAHDFNNLLHIIATNIAVIRVSPPDFDATRSVDAIEHAVVSGRSLIVHLLAFTHKRKFALERVRPAAVLPGICDLARHSLPKTIHMQCVVDPDVWDIAVDLSELELAIINLAVNARDAMPGGGSITVIARNVAEPWAKTLNARLPACDLVAISMSDTGTGIPEHLLQRVFEPFFTTKQEFKGTGLGLSRVYAYAAHLGGCAIASNAADGGAVITLYIPRTDSEPRSGGGNDHTFSGIVIRQTSEFRSVHTAAAVVDDEGSRRSDLGV